MLDTDVLGDFLWQYFSVAERGASQFVTSPFLSKDMVCRINKIVRSWDHQADCDGPPVGVIVVSSLAFVELGRKWESIGGGRFTCVQVKVLLEQPPDWLVVSSIDWDLIPFFCQVSSAVSFLDGSVKNIEWTDAVHVATTLSRGEESLLMTSDRRLHQLPELNGRILF